MTTDTPPDPYDDRDTYIVPPKPSAGTPGGFDQFSEHNIPTLFLIGGAVLAIVACAALGGGIWLLLNQGDDARDTVAAETDVPPSATVFVVEQATQQPTNTALIISPSPTATTLVLPTSTFADDLPTATFTFQPPSPIPPTSTPTPTITPTATSTATASPSPTATPVQSATPVPTLPTNTPVPTTTFTATSTPTITLTPSPTEAQGRLVRLFYDGYSFYAWNTTRENITVNGLTFEAIDATGVSTGYRLNGSSWGQFYPLLEGDKCVTVEITASPGWLRPLQCTVYNAILTPQRSSRSVFWIAREGVTQFRVLWNETEIARCTLDAGQCDIYVP